MKTANTIHRVLTFLVQASALALALWVAVGIFGLLFFGLDYLVQQLGGRP